MNNIVAFIPARSGSKGIPDKNIKLLGSKPLIAYSIESALESDLRVIVNTDSEEYAKIARERGAEVMMRSIELSQDKTSMFEVLKSEIPKVEPLPELVMLLQPTSPFRKKVHIKSAISFLTNAPEYDSLIAAEKVPEKYNPVQVIVTTPMGLRMSNGSPISQRITRRQDFPDAWIPTGSIYLFKTSNLEQGSLYGKKTMIMEVESTININSFEDWELAEQWLKSLQK